ncbi:MAG: cob(I)yrinic acid a,c-diamide adenosyltransferase [Acidobacteria bacterium]|nr:cob(I)yrinic acid a,c-diamide adenosyltransferase [Acidobacteriota bacterium]MCY3966812.1 cob(I)yrinic acid a,c-diamide adenosyltransferase [Acidobacteriota bacterium]
MPRITRVYTRTGDDGTTGLGIRVRVRKDSARVEAYGAIDELNSAVGVALAAGVSARIGRSLAKVQQELFHLGSDLCVPVGGDAPPVPRIEERHVRGLEETIDTLQEELEPLANFVLPGGSLAAAALHLARTICRRAERRLVTLAATEAVGAPALTYVNRLSDALFVMARYENKVRGEADVLWDSRA